MDGMSRARGEALAGGSAPPPKGTHSVKRREDRPGWIPATMENCRRGGRVPRSQAAPSRLRRKIVPHYVTFSQQTRRQTAEERVAKIADGRPGNAFPVVTCALAELPFTPLAPFQFEFNNVFACGADRATCRRTMRPAARIRLLIAIDRSRSRANKLRVEDRRHRGDRTELAPADRGSGRQTPDMVTLGRGLNYRDGRPASADTSGRT